MLKTFKKGGVHPPQNKLTAAKAIESISVPKIVTIPVAQHIGAPAKAIVSKGDIVKTGQLIASSAGFVSANIHSSVSGKIIKIDSIVDVNGYRKEAIHIAVDDDQWAENIDTSNTLVREISIDAAQIIKRINKAGIVGMGGATFPTHVKLSPPSGLVPELLIINGVECEPYLTSDHRIMLEKGEELMIGINLLSIALRINKVVVGIENNKPDAIAHLKKIAEKYSNISICPLKVKYPQGSEKHLIKAITGREVPSGALPVSVGAVVNNVATAYAIYEAVMKNKPLIERVVTVTGKNLANPSNFLVRIGTPIKHVIEAAGGIPENTAKIISGGPMMGKAVANIDAPVTKGTSGILLIDKKTAHRKNSQNCIRCARCVEACPMGLEPFLLMSVSEKQLWDKAEDEKIMNCIECGSCSFTCPANRPLLDYIRYGKNTVGGIIRNRK